MALLMFFILSHQPLNISSIIAEVYKIKNLLFSTLGVSVNMLNIELDNKMNQSVFKAYDVRGRYPSELNEELAFAIGQSLGKHWKKGKVVLGHDARLSSPALYVAVKNGLAENAELDIEEIGLATSPMFYYLAYKFEAVGGVMVTASHNPKDHNGLKVVGQKAEVTSGKEIWNIFQSTRTS